MFSLVLAAALHVPTWMYYGLNGVNKDVPAATMVRSADWIEGDQYDLPLLDAFKRAGGRHAGIYTDPAFVPYCEPPYQPPAGRCRGPFGTDALPESAWYHGPSGARVWRAAANAKSQEALNPADPAARAVYRAHTARVARDAPAIDFFFSDDIGDPLADHFYGFSEPGRETDERTYIAGIRALLAGAVRPVIVNGVDPHTMQPAYSGAILGAPNVLGGAIEGCFLHDELGRLGDDRWRMRANGLLGIAALGRTAVCMQYDNPDDPEGRVYGLASWWLTYDDAHSVIAPLGATRNGATTLFPEYAVVPTRPRSSAGTDVERLRTGAVYRRSFAACYERGRAIGPCTAIVNPGGGEADARAALGGAHARLTVGPGDERSGSSIAWGPLLVRLPAHSAEIVR